MHRWSSYLRTPFGITTLLLLIKYYGLQLIVFQNPNPLAGLLAALPSVLVFTIPLELLLRNKTNKTTAYLLLNIVLSGLMLSVIIYYRQFGIIVTYHALMQANQVMDVSESIFELIKPLYVLYFSDILIYLVLRLIRFQPRSSNLQYHRKAFGGIFATVCAVIILNSYVHGNVLNELKQAERMGIVSYQLHTLFTDIQTANASAPAVLITPDSVRAVKNIELVKQPAYFAAAEGRNLIVVQMESFQNFLVGMELGGQEITPTLNELKEQSFYFKNVYQSIAQGNTSDAEFVVNTGFYPPAQGSASQTYGDKRIPSLPRLLNGLGYQTVTLHTNEVEFWNRIQMYPALGFKKYYDQTYFGDDDIIAFGPSDEVLYKKTLPVLTKLQEQNKPFYAQLIAQSSHHPFLPPENKEMITLPEAWEGTDIGNYIKLANYADKALGQFIDALKESGIWENSVLVVYGDHFGVSSHSLSNEDRELLEQQLGHEYDLRTVHNIPLFIAVPGVTDEGRTFTHTGGQIDIMATVANLLGISLDSYVQFGQDLLNYQDNILASRFYLPTGSFYNDEIMYISGETFGEGTVIPLSVEDPLFEADPNLYRDDFVRMMRMLQMNDIYLESLPVRR